ncbi:MAG: Bug family tripartite tricarboxylate transporter substrate binding protein [Xanthobacteraceae bacterium]
MRWLAGTLLGLCVATPAFADTIRIVIPFAAGGALDPQARILANGLAKLRPNDTFVVENIGGAAGMLGLGAVAKAAPDGRTLLFSPSGPMVISPLVQSNVPFDYRKAFEPVVLTGSVKSALIVRAGLAVHSLKELIAKAKSGAKLTYGSTGVGTSPHISGAMLNHAAGINITHVPYRGLGPAMNNLIGGHIDVITTSVIGVLPYVRAKQAVALATYDTEREDRLPDVPTSLELGFPDLVMPQWYGLLAPAGLPAGVRKALETQALAVLHAPETIKLLATSGVAGPKGTAEFKAILDRDYARWPVLLPKLGITRR